MKRLKRFQYCINVSYILPYEFRENRDGIRLYRFNYRTYKYNKYVGLIYLIKENSFGFESNDREWSFNKIELDRFLSDYDRNIKITNEMIEYLESVLILKKLV